MSVCRFCLANKPRKNISELKVSNHDSNKNYTEIMLFCLGTQVEEDSKLSTKLCLKCFKKTLAFFEFKTMVIKSEIFLKSGSSIEPKAEIPEDKIKKEIVSVDVNDHIDNGFESDGKYDEVENVECNIKDEPKAEESEDEMLSVIKKIKYEFIEEKENAPTKKKKIRTKKIIQISSNKKHPKTKADLKMGCMKVCEECGKYVRDLKAHSLTHLPLEQRLRVKCEICDKVFISAQSKYKHKKRKHFGTKKECPICHKVVKHLNLHAKMHKPDEFKYECAPCGRRFITKSTLEQHVSIHTKDRPFECEICQAKFRLKLSMLMHKRQVHDKEKTHLCQYCSKSFFKKYQLQIHLRSHTKEKPYSCSTCGKCFSSSTIRNNHVLTHSEVKTHACKLCDMSFVRRGYLNAHMLSHTKEKRFPCHYCGVRFHRSDHRKRHEFTAHVKQSQTTDETL